VPARSGGLSKQRREPLHPAVDGDVVDPIPRSVSNSSISRYDRPKRRYQRTASTITSGGKRKPAKADRGTGAGSGRVHMPAVSSAQARSRATQQSRSIAWPDGAVVDDATFLSFTAGKETSLDGAPRTPAMEAGHRPRG
jgi:hypothetical protein